MTATIPGSGVVTREILRRTYAHDASHFLLYPEEVLIATGVEDVVAAFARAHKDGKHLTFRSGGTSLNGQGVTDGILVDVRRGFQSYRVLDGGRRLQVEPGVTIRNANAVLARHGYALGPDPASEIAATVGGVFSNNSSGMSCGVIHNTYHLVESAVFVLPSGTVIDTSKSDARTEFRHSEPDLWQKLIELRQRVRTNPQSVETVCRLFAMKNTMGYSLNAFLDYTDPLDILLHLLVGAEGTLGFVSQVTFRNIPIKPLRATTLLVFQDLRQATSVLPTLAATDPSAIELMDARSLLVAQGLAEAPSAIADIKVEEHAALLVEYRANSLAELQEATERGSLALAQTDVRASFTTDEAEITALWRVRKGLYTTVAGARGEGVTALLEDIVVPVPALAQTCERLSAMFDHHGYRNAVIFGHAKDGNIHFMITDDFSTRDARNKLARFTDEMVGAVLAAKGCLKAEHGTGRAMAPFLEEQYGPELTAVMAELKRAIDPGRILNPDVIVSSDKAVHLHSLKSTPAVAATVDRCVECGYCETRCPSRNLTLTPRTRIVALREMELARRRGDTALVRELTDQFQYYVRETCAVDGLCERACPLEINTGDLVRELRAQAASKPWTTIWGVASKHWGLITRLAAVALNVVRILPPTAVEGMNRSLRRVFGSDNIPLWTSDLPGGGHTREHRTRQSHDGVHSTTCPQAVFFPSCLNQMFAPSGGKYQSQTDFEYLCEIAGISILVPTGVSQGCCGTPWSSKGMTGGYADNQQRVLRLLSDASGLGRLPVVCDASSCTEGLLKLLKGHGITVVDAPVFLVERVLPALDQRFGSLASVGSITVHPTCATAHLGSTQAIVDVARAVSDDVYVPPLWGCCAFAGDRGMLHPELTESATRNEAQQVAERGADHHVSSNRTCEIGMSRATGREYGAVVSLLAQAVRSSLTSQESVRGTCGAE